jgi:uncharacterized membrane protein
MTLATLFSLRKGTPGHARLIYAGLLAGLLVPGLNFVAAAMAYFNRGHGDAVIESHTRNQLHIFAKSVVYVGIGLILTYFLVGVLVIMAAIIWYVLRNARGLQALAANRPADNPASWLL